VRWGTKPGRTSQTLAPLTEGTSSCPLADDCSPFTFGGPACILFAIPDPIGGHATQPIQAPFSWICVSWFPKLTFGR
jgi:hypothetical protein